jgi:type VI secretion system protein ImpF
MPPPVQPKRGIQPSILDRLIDPESAGTTIMNGYTVQQMYEAVLRDLQDLLNTVHTAHDISEDYPETRDSIVGYGLPDLTSIEAISSDQRNAIGKAIKKAIERFEPRLRAVKVTLMKADEDLTRMSVRFRVDARLTVDPAPDVAFDTILEMGSGTYLVTPAAK